jgi:signal transduction histidine kinase
MTALGGPSYSTAPANKDFICGHGFAEIIESLQRREALLSASARASRLILEAPDVMGAVPDVLRIIGEAARVDRVSLLLSQTGPSGEPLLVVVAEWLSEGAESYLGNPALCTCDERSFADVSAELRSGRSVCMNKEDVHNGRGLEGVGTKSKAIVPIFVDGEYLGAVGFDNTRLRRAIDTAELSALETAAGVIGAAMHRERLVDAVRRERERAAEERVAELAKANAAIRGNLERLANEPDPHSFLGHVLLEATRQLDAAAGTVVVRDDEKDEWCVYASVRGGVILPPPFSDIAPCAQKAFNELLLHNREPFHVNLDAGSDILWPDALDYLRKHGHASIFMLPLVFGERAVGFVGLGFPRSNPVSLQRSELLVALAQQATLAIELTRLANSAKEAAVLVERNRMGQEIHDGLAQAFTGILMQLGAAEEFDAFSPCSPVTSIFTRIRDLAREGLAEARRSVMAIRPDQTKRRGLELALRQLAERSTIPGRITCTFEGGGMRTGLPPEHEHELLRIAQEALSNAMRHAHPTTVRIAMTEDATHLTMSITDNGRGMNHKFESYAQRGFGLTSMRERATAIGGQWLIESRAGEGTRVSVKLPKQRAA